MERERKRVRNGERWTDSEDDCITCSCNVSEVHKGGFLQTISGLISFRIRILDF